VALPAGYISQGGLTWMPNNAAGTMDWSTADNCRNNTTINGQTGWRLPTLAELSSLRSSGALAGQGIGRHAVCSPMLCRKNWGQTGW
jgi:hypothetical protein